MSFIDKLDDDNLTSFFLLIRRRASSAVAANSTVGGPAPADVDVVVVVVVVVVTEFPTSRLSSVTVTSIICTVTSSTLCTFTPTQS